MGELRLDVDLNPMRSAFGRCLAEIKEACRNEARAAAEHIAADAKTRVHRRAADVDKPAAITVAAGIQVHEETDAFVVTSTREPQPNVPLYLEFGTEHAPAYKFFGPAIAVELPIYSQRMAEAVQQAINDSGLGE